MTSKDLQKIKGRRLTVPEKIILESFKGLQEYTHKDDSDWIYYKSDKGIFYEYNEKYGSLYYDYDLIYLKINSYFDCNYRDMCDFVRDMMEKHLKLKVVTSGNNHINTTWQMENCLKLKVVTT